MKKLMFGLAALAAGSVMAIESANVVGYQQMEIHPGLNLVGTSFLNCDGKGRPNIQASFTDATTKAVAGEADDIADYIQIFDNARKGYFDSFFFYKGEEPDADYDYKWLDGEYEIAEFVIPSGAGFWYTSRSAEKTTLTSSGMVGADTVEVTIKPGLNLVVNPFPTALAINNGTIDWKSSNAVAGEADDVGDYIQVFDGVRKGYFDSYFFYQGEEADEDYDFKWLDGEYNVTEKSIPAGAGFWYTHRGDTDITITFKSPLAK